MRLCRCPARCRLLAGTALIAALVLPGAAAGAPATGDFDGDGTDDLAVGAPSDDVSGQPRAGAVNVIYGAPGGLTERGDQQLTTRPQRVPGVPQDGAMLGAALASGDFDGDGYGDLAVGAPGDDVGALRPAPGSGRVVVFYGSPDGLEPRPPAGGFSQNSAGVQGEAEAGDRFGDALAAADFDGDGRDDLAIGAPGDSIDGARGAGAVTVVYGRPDGLESRTAQLWTQNSSGVKGVAGNDHRFGSALAAADVSANGRADLAVGIPGGVIGGRRAGAVLVLYGARGGLSSTDDLWSQDAGGIKGRSENGDGFGSALAIADFDGDEIGDLAIGAPLDSVSNAGGAGAVNVLYGTGRGLSERADELWTRDTLGVKGRASGGEHFGAALAAQDASRNGIADLAIGAPFDSVGGSRDAGAVNVLFGSSRGLREVGDELWTQGTSGIKGAVGDDRFGSALASGGGGS